MPHPRAATDLLLPATPENVWEGWGAGIEPLISGGASGGTVSWWACLMGGADRRPDRTSSEGRSSCGLSRQKFLPGTPFSNGPKMIRRRAQQSNVPPEPKATKLTVTHDAWGRGDPHLACRRRWVATSSSRLKTPAWTGGRNQAPLIPG